MAVSLTRDVSAPLRSRPVRRKGAVLSAADPTGTAQAPVTAGVLDLLEVRTLFESGKGAGKLDAEEIALALDELDLDAAQLDEFYTALEEAQVDVVGAEQSEAEDEKEWAAEAEISTDTLQLFLKDIGKVPLLTAAQEVGARRNGSSSASTPPSRRWSRRTCASVVSIAKRYRNQGLPVPRPDPGGHDRARPGGREVRLPQGLQVLDLRHLVDPAGRRPRDRRQGPDDPDAGARRREAEQDPPLRAQAPRRARARADRPGDRARPRLHDRRGRADPAVARRRPSRWRSRSATTTNRSSVTSSPT